MCVAGRCGRMGDISSKRVVEEWRRVRGKENSIRMSLNTPFKALARGIKGYDGAVGECYVEWCVNPKVEFQPTMQQDGRTDSETTKWLGSAGKWAWRK